MYIPNSMKNKIARTFYDKTISLLIKTEEVDEEGGVINSAGIESSTFKGNVNFSNFKEIQEDYGLDYNIDISITTNEDIEINSLIEYQNVVYIVTDVIPSDSHYMVVATKWHQ